MPPRGRRLAAVLPDAGRSFADRVRESVERLSLQPEDVALAELAVRYAETIDRAASIAARVASLPPDPDFAEELKRLALRVSAQGAVSDLGPKLLAALDALGATPKARATSGKPPPPSGRSKLDGLRGGAA